MNHQAKQRNPQRANQILTGSCLDVLPTLPAAPTYDLCMTSPPYAMQRNNQYGGIPENDYPEWTVRWMAEVRRVLKPSGSVAIVIRPHVHRGELADYVLHTRLAVRKAGWVECEELPWIKPNAAPLGSIKNPRRSWESILWFSPSRRRYCNPQANGTPSSRCAYVQGTKGVGQWVHTQTTTTPKKGIARCRDYVEVGTSANQRGNPHSAQYPVQLAEWIIKLLSPPGGNVLDPFVGSGSTCVAAANLGREWTGIELDGHSAAYARRRLAKAA
jgi:site-specific DNA-methyltransferase (adenine-specific)